MGVDFCFSSIFFETEFFFFSTFAPLVILQRLIESISAIFLCGMFCEMSFIDCQRVVKSWRSAGVKISLKKLSMTFGSSILVKTSISSSGFFMPDSLSKLVLKVKNFGFGGVFMGFGGVNNLETAFLFLKS